MKEKAFNDLLTKRRGAFAPGSAQSIFDFLVPQAVHDGVQQRSDDSVGH